MALVIANAGLIPAADAGIPYRYTFQVTGGKPPFQWRTDPDGLPMGIKLDVASGALTGTPTSVFFGTVLIRVSDNSDPSPQKAGAYVTLRINKQPRIIHAELPPASVGAPYEAQLRATGGTIPLTWSMAAGELPAGLTLSEATGQIRGVPTHSEPAENAEFSVAVRDSAQGEDRADCSITVAPAPPNSWTVLLHSQWLEVDDLLGRRGRQLVLVNARCWEEPTTQVSSDGGESWELIDGRNPPVLLDSPGIASGGGPIWLVGRGTYDAIGYVFSFDGIEWTQVTNGALPAITNGSAVTWHDGEIWVLGGRRSLNLSNNVFSSADGKTWVQHPSPPWKPRVYAGAASFQSHLWICGGVAPCLYPERKPINDLWSSPDGIEWTSRGPVPWNSSDAAVALVATETRLYAIVVGNTYSGSAPLVAWYMGTDGVWSANGSTSPLSQINEQVLGFIPHPDTADSFLAVSGVNSQLVRYNP